MYELWVADFFYRGLLDKKAEKEVSRSLALSTSTLNSSAANPQSVHLWLVRFLMRPHLAVFPAKKKRKEKDTAAWAGGLYLLPALGGVPRPRACSPWLVRLVRLFLLTKRFLVPHCQFPHSC